MLNASPVTFRANSPSPIRKRGSLHDLFNTKVDSNMALTGRLLDST